MVAYGRVKTKENCKQLSLKVVAVAYERWSLTRGSNYSDLTEKFLVFWKSGRSREVVAMGGSTVYVLGCCHLSPGEVFSREAMRHNP